MMYLGIDPGKGGGLAALDERGSVLALAKMPETDRDLFDLFAQWNGVTTETRAVLERVRSSPQMGVVSAFTFGRGVGALMMALTACRIPFDEVTPQRWQAALGCLTGGDKNVSKARAQALFPSVKVTHHLADALLLAEYLRRRERSFGQSHPEVSHGNEEGKGEEQAQETVQARGREAAPQRPRASSRHQAARSGAPRHGGRPLSRAR